MNNCRTPLPLLLTLTALMCSQAWGDPAASHPDYEIIRHQDKDPTVNYGVWLYFRK